MRDLCNGSTVNPEKRVSQQQEAFFFHLIIDGFKITMNCNHEALLRKCLINIGGHRQGVHLTAAKQEEFMRNTVFEAPTSPKASLLGLLRSYLTVALFF